MWSYLTMQTKLATASVYIDITVMWLWKPVEILNQPKRSSMINMIKNTTGNLKSNRSMQQSFLFLNLLFLVHSNVKWIKFWELSRAVKRGKIILYFDVHDDLASNQSNQAQEQNCCHQQYPLTLPHVALDNSIILPTQLLRQNSYALQIWLLPTLPHPNQPPKFRI